MDSSDFSKDKKARELYQIKEVAFKQRGASIDFILILIFREIIRKEQLFTKSQHKNLLPISMHNPS
jgi:hypothetical protein